MQRAWYWKAGLVVALIATSVLYLLPTFFWYRLPHWYTSVFSDVLNLGLDLRGGIHMVLGVEVEKAVFDKADRMTEDIEIMLEDKGIAYDKVQTLENSADIAISFKEGTDVAAARDQLIEYFGNLETAAVEPDGPGQIVLTIEEEYRQHIQRYAVDQALDTLRNRIDSMALKEPLVARQGESSIVIQIPGMEDIDRARRLIGQTAQLEFKICDDEASFLNGLKDSLPPGVELQHDNVKSPDGALWGAPYLVADTREQILQLVEGSVPDGRQIAFQQFEEPKTLKKRFRTFTLFSKTSLTGDSLTDARVNIDQRENRPYVAISFDRDGANRFEQVTGDNVKRRMAIVLDGEVESAPVIRQRIGGGQAVIELNALEAYGTLLQEAQDLALVLRAGALPAPVKFEMTQTVGPSLGEESIRNGGLATLLGVTAVLIFMLFYYGVAGIIADITLVVNMLFLMAILAVFGATLTLPGIAGIALTIGMAVDANILIYERVREELRLGKTPKAAVEAGWARAFWTIFDAQLTTAIAGFVLWNYGSGPIKGFAVTLIIGIATSMFTSIWVARVIMDFYLAKSRRLSVGIRY